jgi:hypothetical protein
MAGTSALAASALVDEVAGCSRTMFRENDVPANPAVANSAPVEVGVKFRTDRDGYITGVRFYKGSGNTGTHLGRLWSSRGEKLAEATFTQETATGWQQVNFAVPVRVAGGTTYVASYYAPVGRYSYNGSYFASAPRIRPPLTGLQNGADGGNGVYRNGAGFPNSTYQSMNYWVDVVFDTPANDPCPASIWTDTQVPGVTTTSATTSVELGVKFRSSIDGYIQGIQFFKSTGNTGTHIGRLWSRTGEKLAEGIFVAESPTGWQQMYFAQPVAISAGTTYVASYFAPNGRYTYGTSAFATSGVTRGPLTALQEGVDGSNGVYVYGAAGGFPTASFQSTNYGVDVLFTPASTLPCPCSIWPPTGEPYTLASTDTAQVELGVRFRPLRNGYIKGIRYYKGEGNNGTHIGRLWSNTGTNLAQATFTNETYVGWQQVLFATPVAVTAGTSYVASYLAPVGRYSYAPHYFSVENTTRGPLAATVSGVGGTNGVYRYGSGFPNSSYQNANYWVDVVYETTLADVTPPVVVNQWPAPGAPATLTSTTVTARFSEAVAPASVTATVQAAGGSSVAGSTTYDSATRTARFTPSSPLAFSTGYNVTIGASDTAGNPMTPAEWSFTTTIDPNAGPGGPVGVITSNTNPYSHYYAEILRAEGLNLYSIVALESLSAAALAPLDTVILAELALTQAQADTLAAWVDGGGRLIAMRPDAKLAGLLGITSAGTTLNNAYLKVDVTAPPGGGIVDATIQFHGTADRYTLSGASAVATLYSNATTATTNPAVTMRTVGANGGWAAAFTYDLARSVVLTRQGNPAWAGQERDGVSPIRSSDMFVAGGGQPDWVDLNKVAIPQADEQQRLLVNLIQHLNVDRKPLPKFWYLPNGEKAVVIATGDDEWPDTTGTQGRFERYIANSPVGCDPADWECLRFTSYIWEAVGLTDAQARAFHEQGFEIGLHTQNFCVNFTPANLPATYTAQLAEWAQKYFSLPMPTTGRYHCIVWSDWDSQPKAELQHGIRFDTNYYYFPASWVQNRPGFMTGSGIPMRFTDTTGNMIDVFQGTTQLTDESGQTYPFTPNTLLDRAVGPEGYYGMFVANMHDSNKPTSFEDDQLVASAQNHGVPVVTSRDVLNWLHAKEHASFGNLSWGSDTLSFTIAAPAAAAGLVAMLPTAGVGGTTLSSMTRDGASVSFTTQTVKGIEYAMFPGLSGAYAATYTSPSALLTAASVMAPSNDADVATVSWATSVPSTAEIEYGTSPTALTEKHVGETARNHRVKLEGLKPGTTYYYRVRSTDHRDRTVTWPAGGEVATFRTPAVDTRGPVVSNLRITPLPDSTVRVTWDTDEPSNSVVTYGATALNLEARDDQMVTSHYVVLANLEANTAFTLRASSTDPSNNTSAPAAEATRFTTAPPGVADQTLVGFRTGTESGALVVNGTGLAEVTLTGGNAGALESRVLDAQQNATWRNGNWEATVPSGARLVVSVRTGNTPRPDATWSAWSTVASVNSPVRAPAGRFLQYRLELTAGPGGRAPVVRWIGFTHSGELPGNERRRANRAG